jgi:pilus assembly protein FimV
MKLKRFTSRLMAAGLVALPLTTHAAGLGNLSVTSALGQPLTAEIELLAADKAELDSLAASIASDQAFKDARIEFAPVLSTLRFAVAKKPNGKAVLKVTSSRPVNDPFIDMLIELNWASGRLVREYTILLDPPGGATKQTVKPVVITPAQAPAAVAKPVIAPAPAPESTSPEPSQEAVKAVKPLSPAAPKAAEAKPQPDSGPTSSPRSTPDSVRVKRGDTLAKIAQRIRPEGVALEQALVGLYRENTEAFSDKNINRLKAGSTLKVPNAEDFATIDRKEARREVKLQTDNWQAYRHKLADTVVEAPAADKAAPGQAASGKITSKVEDKATPPNVASKDVLKLSKLTPVTPVDNTAAAKKAAEAQTAQNKLRAQEDEATAREKALKESSGRVSALEKQVVDMQALVKMKEEAAKLAQQKAEKEAAQLAQKKPEPKIVPKAVQPPPVTNPIPPTVVAPVEPVDTTEPANSWYAALLNNPIYWAVGAALIGLAGLLGWMMSAGRRRKPVTAFEDSILTGGDVHPNTVMGGATGGSINTGDTSFLTDFSQAGLGTIDTHDVDPIAEAEVYMAYGRDAQAEEILKEAILKNPDRHEIRMKLLEIYAARRNPQAFENVAGELYAALGNKSNNLWDKAAEMGRGIDPTNPLYGDVQSGVPGAKAAPAPIPASAPAQVIETVAATSAIAGGAMVFDTLAASPPAPKDKPETLEFEGAPTMPYVAPKPEVHSAPPAESQANDLDFDLSGLDVPDAGHNDLDLDMGLDNDVGSDSKFDFSGLDLDLGDSSGGELDDVGTKLDLARAYVEMGDNEGAREILNEVIVEGSDKQKSDAKGMLSSLG